MGDSSSFPSNLGLCEEVFNEMGWYKQIHGSKFSYPCYQIQAHSWLFSVRANAILGDSKTSRRVKFSFNLSFTSLFSGSILYFSLDIFFSPGWTWLSVTTYHRYLHVPPDLACVPLIFLIKEKNNCFSSAAGQVVHFFRLSWVCFLWYLPALSSLIFSFWNWLPSACNLSDAQGLSFKNIIASERVFQTNFSTFLYF